MRRRELARLRDTGEHACGRPRRPSRSMPGWLTASSSVYLCEAHRLPRTRHHARAGSQGRPVRTSACARATTGQGQHPGIDAGSRPPSRVRRGRRLVSPTRRGRGRAPRARSAVGSMRRPMGRPQERGCPRCGLHRDGLRWLPMFEAPSAVGHHPVPVPDTIAMGGSATPRAGTPTDPAPDAVGR